MLISQLILCFFGAGMVGMMMMTPDLNFQQNVAGTVGGGGLPTDTSIVTAALSLALVPLGLSAVAIFPPFARLENSHRLFVPKRVTNSS